MRKESLLHPLFIAVALAAVSVGCGKSGNGPVTVSEPTGTAASPATSPAANGKQAEKPEVPAEKTSSAPSAKETASTFAPPTESKKQEIVASKPPATAAEFVNAIDLRKMPRINETRILDEGPTHVHYSAKSTIAGADAFCTAELTSKGWKPAPVEPRITDQYSERLFEKNGFYVRLSMGAGADEGVAGISLYNLGNIDLRSLPRLGDAPITEGSSPVNVNYKTDASLADATKYCREQLTKLGWIEFGSLHAGNIDVPHVKQLNWIRNATRLDVLISKFVDQPAGQTHVAYMAQHGLPFDLPVMPDGTALKIDLYSGRAEYVCSSTPEQVFTFYKSTGERLGWKPREDGTHVAEKTASLMVEDQPELGVAIYIARDDKQTKISLTRLSMKEKPAVAEVEETPAPKVATTETPAVVEPTKPDPVEDAAADILKEVQKSLQGDLGDLQKELGKIGVELPKGVLANEPKSNVTIDPPAIDPPAEEEKPSPADLKLPKLENIGHMSFDKNNYTLKHVVAYRTKEFDEVIPVVVLSEKPIDSKKLSQILASGETVWLSDLIGFNMPVAIQIRLGKQQTSVSAYVDGASINVSSSDAFETKFKVIGPRLRGTLKQREPGDFFDKKYDLDASFDLDMINAPGQKSKSK